MLLSPLEVTLATTIHQEHFNHFIVGNLHLPQKNRPSLVCDLVEEFCALVVDSLVAYLINSNIFEEDTLNIFLG